MCNAIDAIPESEVSVQERGLVRIVWPKLVLSDLGNAMIARQCGHFPRVPSCSAAIENVCPQWTQVIFTISAPT